MIKGLLSKWRDLESAPEAHVDGVDIEDNLKRGQRVLEVTNLSVDFGVNKEWVPAAIDLNYHVDAGEARLGYPAQGSSARRTIE